MITLKEFLPRYCNERNLPSPSKADYENCGRIVSFHFKNFWSKSISLEHNTLIPDSGFLIHVDGDKKIIIQGYPNSFEPSMAGRCDVYFANKGKPKKSVKEVIKSPINLPKKRKRNLLQWPPKPEFSAKPSSNSKRTF